MDTERLVVLVGGCIWTLGSLIFLVRMLSYGKRTEVRQGVVISSHTRHEYNVKLFCPEIVFADADGQPVRFKSAAGSPIEMPPGTEVPVRLVRGRPKTAHLDTGPKSGIPTAIALVLAGVFLICWPIFG